MKITKEQLKTIIQEELEGLHQEGFFGDIARSAKKGLYDFSRPKGEPSYDELYTELIGTQAGLQDLMHTNPEELTKWTQGFFSKRGWPEGTKINEMVMQIDDLIDQTRQGPDEDGVGMMQVDKFEELQRYIKYYRENISDEIKSLKGKFQSNPEQANAQLPILAQKLSEVLYIISGASQDTGEGPSRSDISKKHYAPHIEKALRAVQKHVTQREKSYMSESKRSQRKRKNRG